MVSAEKKNKVEKGDGVLFYVIWYKKLFLIRWHWDRDLKKYSCKSLYMITGRKNIPERGSQTFKGLRQVCIGSVWGAARRPVLHLSQLLLLKYFQIQDFMSFHPCITSICNSKKYGNFLPYITLMLYHP